METRPGRQVLRLPLSAKYTVFLSSGGSPNKAYGVLGLADPLEEVIGPYLPRLITAVLLPFKGKIIYDGLVSGYNITFGGGIKRMLNEEYKQAKEAFGIITSLPLRAEPAAPAREAEEDPRNEATARLVGGQWPLSIRRRPKRSAEDTDRR